MSRFLITLTVMLPTLIEIIDISIVNVALGHIRGSLSTSIDEATWAITSYLVSNAVIIPMTGWLTRLFGRKRYLIFSISLFTASSFLCGSAWNIQSLVFFRVLQGIGGGALQPLSQAILLETYPPKQHGMAMAIFGVGIMFGPIIGPLLGGWITDAWSWHWIFYINIPIGVLSILMVIFFITDPPHAKRARIKIDYAGLMLLVIGVGSLQIVLDKGYREDWFSSGLIVALSAVAATALILFVILEYFREEPVVNVRVFRNLSYATGNVVMFFVFFNLFGSIVLLPIYLQSLLGYTATLAGLVLGPGGLITLLAMPLSGKLVTKVNPKWLVATGMFITALATYMMGNFTLHVDFATAVWPRVVLGLGMPFIMIPIMTLMLSGVKKEELGNATGIFNFLRNLGASFGVAFVTTLLSRKAQSNHAQLVGNLSPLDPVYQQREAFLTRAMELKGFDPVSAKQGALGAMHGELARQSTMLAFNEVFLTMTVLIIAVIPLIFLIKRPKTPRGGS